MKVLVFILSLIGLGIFGAVVLSTLTVVMITAVAGLLATLGARFGNRERSGWTIRKSGRLARQEKM